jgi:Tfp pilus assembly protein PilX
MKPRLRTVRDERGVALPLALFALVMLSGLLLVFLSMAGMEPSIATNLSDVTRARNLAEAGIEWAFDALAAAPNLNGLLTTNACPGLNLQLSL